MPVKSLAVVGGGIVGLATALKFGEQFPDATVVLLEKEPNVGMHQTGNNSGVLHAGLYYKPGSLKAKLAVTGIRKMVAFCREHGIAHEICGKLVVAVSEEELPRLDDLFVRGTQNGLRGLERLGPEQMREIEPHVAGVAAVRVPEEGIVDYSAVCRAMAAIIGKQGGRVVTSAPVRNVTARSSAAWVIETDAGSFQADFLINCAGLHSDRVSELAGERRQARIVPFRGEYYNIRGHAQHLVRNLIYPVPDPKFPFLGVHFTRLIHGGIEAGPNAVLAFAREGYSKTDINFGDLFDAVTYKGFWRFAARYPKVCWAELERSFSKRLFCESLQRLVPDIRPEHLETGGAGVRAQVLLPNGDLVQDFLIVSRPNALHVLNAPSPGATASLAIAEHLVSAITSVQMAVS